MALVAYGSSDESENEEDESVTEKQITIDVTTNSKSKEASQQFVVQDKDTGDVENTLFTKLPQPKQTSDIIEEAQDEFLLKKETTVEKPKPPKQKIIIGIPSLSQFDSDDEGEGEKVARKQPAKASGLFAVLPPPKGVPLSNKSFIPNVLTRKVPPKPAPPKQPKKIIIKPKQVQKEDLESDDEDLGELPETFDEETWQKVCAPKQRAPKRSIEQTLQEQPTSLSFSTINAAPEPPKPYEGLDNAAFKELVGNSKRRRENIKLIDINEEEVLPDKDQWLTKSLTDPSYAPKPVIEEPVNDTCRKKHHITYLAQQAKANEQELQNQWSQNKFNRKLTQSKYGF